MINIIQIKTQQSKTALTDDHIVSYVIPSSTVHMRGAKPQFHVYVTVIHLQLITFKLLKTADHSSSHKSNRASYDLSLITASLSLQFVFLLEPLARFHT